jgi:hypothetical protein
MIRARRLRALTCALVASTLVLGVAVAYGAARYAGTTSQRAPISFAVAGGKVHGLRFKILIKCPSGHVWRVTATRFPAIKITHSSFAQKFKAEGAQGSATVKGRLSGGQVTGTLSDRTFEPPEHHYCRGRATFDLHRHAAHTALTTTQR